MKELVLKVKDIIQETEDTITIIFDKNDLEYEPGQYLMLKIPHEGNVLFRAYSLCTSPFVDEFPAITVKRVYKGKVSNFLNSNLKIGDTISSHYPKGKFTTKYDINNERHVVCIAAGSGITPLYAIMKSILHKEPSSCVSLIYTNRNKDSIIFKESLEEWGKKFSTRFNVINILTRPDVGWQGFCGRPNTTFFADIFNILKKNHDLPSQYYLCGPQNMMNNAITTLKGFNTSHTDIFYESFGTSNTSEVNSDSYSISNSEENFLDKQKEDEISKVTILYEGDTYNLNIPKDQTILEAALDVDIDLPFACSIGTCNVCMAKCKKGCVEMECDDGLTDEELENKYILTCVSRPKSNEIEIEIPEEYI